MLALDASAVLDVVELTPAVVEASRAFFGVPREHPRLAFHISDALEFDLAVCKYDAVVIDVAAADTGATEEEQRAGLHVDLPPRAFLREDYIRHKVLPALRPGGWAAMNVLAGRLALESIAETLERCAAQVYVLGTDPNYVFMFSASPADDPVLPLHLVHWAARRGLQGACHNVLLDVAKTASHLRHSVLLGWFTARQFRELLRQDSLV